jgi:hypothetical protein
MSWHSSANNFGESVQWFSKLVPEGGSRKLCGQYRIQNLFWSRLGVNRNTTLNQVLAMIILFARALPVYLTV